MVLRVVFPARAGMILPTSNPLQNRLCIPRESGDDPLWRAINNMKENVFPARAGMILMNPYFGEYSISIPRESGDDPGGNNTPIPEDPYSPRERG